MIRPCGARILWIFLLSVILLGACSSTEPSRFYLLNPAFDETQPGVKKPAFEPCLDLTIGPVGLPEYLDRSQIVTRATRNELKLARFDRWAEPLSNTIPRIIAQNLAGMLCIKTISVYPSKTAISPAYRIDVEVIRMDGTLDNNAVLEVWWSISSTAGKPVVAEGRPVYIEPVRQAGYQAFVEALDRTIAALCTDIAKTIMALEKQNPTQR